MPKTQNESGAVREFVNARLDYVRQTCPSLTAVAATLLPFADVIESVEFSDEEDDLCPQPQLRITIDDPRNRHGFDRTVAVIDASSVSITRYENFYDIDQCRFAATESSLPELWAYLAQLPKPCHAYGRLVQ